MGDCENMVKHLLSFYDQLKSGNVEDKILADLLNEVADALRDYDRLCVRAIPAHKTELIEELNRIRGRDEKQNNAKK